MTVKKHFTLLEICLVLVLIAAGATYLGIQGWHMIQTHQFERGICDLARYMRTCSLQSLCTQEDVYIRFIQTKDGVFYENVAQKVRQKLPQAVFFACKGKPLSSSSLHLFSTGQVVGDGPLVFHSPLGSFAVSTTPPLFYFQL